MSRESMMNKLGLTQADFEPTRDSNNAKLQALMDIITIDKVASDKLGYDWEVIKVGDLEVQKKYVANPNAKGTQTNPFTTDDILIDNAYYIINDVKYVCMSGQLIEFDW